MAGLGPAVACSLPVAGLRLGKSPGRSRFGDFFTDQNLWRDWHKLAVSRSPAFPEAVGVVSVKDGNVAVGILLSAVVFIASMYVGNGVSAVTKALVPQPEIGSIRIME